jgi:hypothetical protein
MVRRQLAADRAIRPRLAETSISAEPDDFKEAVDG